MSPLPMAIGLGANLGTDAEIAGRFALAAMALGEALEAPLRRSHIYRSAPRGPIPDQPAFLNAVIAADRPEIDPVLIMAALLEIERALGRERSPDTEQGPRVLDLDLLLFGDEAIAMAEPISLWVPHPRLIERRFALLPLAELIGEEVVIPGQSRTLAQGLAATADQDVQVATDLHF